MRLVCISDTHGTHHQLKLPEGDVLVHAGDISNRGTPEQVQDFIHWFSHQPFTYKIFIAGNHDFLAEDDPGQFRSLLDSTCIYLENESIELEGVRFWGSPVTPWFFNWAFNRQRGEEIREYWHSIPEETDVLITHGPPYGIRDLNLHGQLTGCEELNHKVWEVSPKVHLFGHIHEAYGITEINGIQFVNAALVDVGGKLVNAPLVVEV